MDDLDTLINEIVSEERPVDVFRAVVDATSAMAKLVDNS